MKENNMEQDTSKNELDGEQHFTQLFANAPSPIAILKGKEFVYEMANQKYLELIGRSEIIGKSVSEVLPELEGQGVLRLLNHVYKTGETFSATEINFKLNRKGDDKLHDIYLNLVYQAYKNNKDEIEGIFFFANDVTEQVLGRKKLEESEKLYRQLIETAQEGIWMIDKNNLTIFVNNKLCELLEYSEEEMIGKPNTFFMDEGGKKIAAKAKQARIPGSNEKLDIPLISKTGKKVWVTLSGSAKYDEAGMYNGGLAMVTDITKRKEAEEELIRSKELFRALIEDTHDAIIMYDKDLIILYRSPSATRMLGYNDEDRLDKKLNAEIHEEDEKNLKKHISEVLSNPGKAFPFTLRTKHKEGHYIWIEGVTTNLLENKSVNGIVLNFRNITERKEAEEALRLSEQRFKSIIEYSEDIVTLTDATGNLTYVSPNIERILGYTNEESKGHSPAEIIHPDDLQISHAALQKVLENPGKPIFLEIRNRKKDGSYIWLSGTIINMLYVQGVNAIVSNTRDITQRKIAEDRTRQNEALLAEAQHVAKYGNWNLDIITGVLTWSDELYNVFETDKELLGTFESFIDLVDEEYREAVRQTNRHARLTGEPFDIEYCITTSNGEKRIIQDRGYAEYDSNGKVLRLFGAAQNITERKKAEETIIKEKELSDSIINSLTGIFYLLDSNGNFLRWNRNAEIVTGYTGEEISKLRATDFFDEDEKEIIVEKIAEVFLNGKSQVEAFLLTKDGSKIPYFFKATAADFEGERCLIGMAINITELKKAEATIKESEAKFRAFFESSMDAILFATINGQILEANNVAREIFGITENDICTAKASKLTDTTDERLQQLLRELYLTGHAKGELTMISKDGSKFPCEITAVTYKDSLQEERISIIIRNIAERKLAEEKLLQINERYKLATRATSNAIWDWNLQTGGMFWSEGYKLTFGYDVDDTGETFERWSTKIHPADYERVHNKIQKIITGNNGTFWEDEYRFIKADGSVAHIYDRGNLVYDQQNKPVRFVGAMQDITLRKEIETERELLIKELMKTNTDLKQFSYITSHNLRAPLSNIISVLNIIDYPSLDESNRELIEMLQISCKQLTTTIDDLSNILIIKNNINVVVTPLDVEDTLELIHKTFTKDLEKVEGSVITDFKIRELHFHKTYLESIFVNLISNAIKYRSPDRKLVIQISTKNDAEGNCVLRFTDNGVGIDLKRHKDKVFGLYQRFHNEIEGHGLGLFIIKAQINALGGDIDIKSEVGEGTTFIITLKKIK